MSDKAFNTKPYSIIHLELLSYDNVLFVSNFLHTVAGNDIVGTGKYYCHYTIFLSVPHEGNVNKAVLFNKRNSQPQKSEFKVDRSSLGWSCNKPETRFLKPMTARKKDD